MNVQTRSTTRRPRCGLAENRRRGFALVVVLMLLAITTILAVAFAFTMRTERVVAYNMVSGQRADMIAHNALNHAISLLANNIPDPSAPGAEISAGEAKGWYTHPGRLSVFGQDEDDVQHIDLYTGTCAADPTEGYNLNAQSPITLKFPITGAADPMWVKWKDVLEDNTRAAASDNRLVGRYAFWIDDESTKINFNTARGKPDMSDQVQLPNSWIGDPNRHMQEFLYPAFALTDADGTLTNYALGQPQSINLDLAELNINVPDLQAKYANLNSFFTHPEDVRFFMTDAETTYEQNKFSLTPFSRAPEFNVFGKSRLMVMQKINDLAASPTHQHFTHPTEPMVFWGGYAGVGNNTSADANHMGYLRRPTIEALAKYFDRNDWPGFGGKRFRWNNGPDGKAESDQIALNMSNMGYWGATSAGSTTSYINHLIRWGMFGGFSPVANPNKGLIRGPLSDRAMLPMYYGPQLTEIRCTITPEAGGVIANGPGTADDQTTTRIKFQFSYELWMPPGYFVRGSSPAVFANNSSNGGNYELMMSPSYIFASVEQGGAEITNGSQMLNFSTAQNKSQRNLTPSTSPSNGYQVVTPQALYIGKGNGIRREGEDGNWTNRENNRFKFAGAADVRIRLRYGIWPRNKGTFVQAVPVLVPLGETGNSPDMSSTNESLTYLEFEFKDVDFAADPASKSVSFEVTDPTLAGNRMAWVKFEDEDTMGAKNTTFQDHINTLEVVEPDIDQKANKIATWNLEKGGTGASGSATTRATNIGMFAFTPTGVQRGLQWDTLRFHDYADDENLPDWLILDLLAPVFPSPISLAHSTAGKINLNSRIYPTGASTFAPPKRTLPTKALFKNMPKGDEAAESVLAWQEDEGNSLDYIGRLCTVPKVADNDTMIQGARSYDFDRESLIRNLAGLVTTQSNTFGVWGVAQSVQIRKRNADYGVFQKGDMITGQRRFYAVVERYVWQGREGVAGNGSVDTSGEYQLAAYDGATPGAGAKYNDRNPAIFWKDGKWALIDGPVGPVSNEAMGEMPYSPSSLEEANNPIGPVIKYRVIHMQYVD